VIGASSFSGMAQPGATADTVSPTLKNYLIALLQRNAKYFSQSLLVTPA
jgi:hypothetical protein